MRKHKMIVVVAGVLLFASLVISAQEKPADVAGKWEMKWQTPRGEQTLTLNFEQNGANLTGTMTGPRGGESSLTGKVKGNSIEFTVKRQTPRGEREIQYTGTVEGDTIKGTAQMGPREINWTATRVKE